MSLKSVPILAIDPSTKAGWALWKPELRAPEHGTWVLHHANQKGAMYNAFWLQMEQTLAKYDLLDEPNLQIVMEEALPNPKDNSGHALKLAAAWEAIVSLFCVRRMLSPPTLVSPNTWYKQFVGPAGRPGKKLPRGQFSKFRKEQTMLRCNKGGLYPANDNEADAIGILWWLMHNGVEIREQDRAEAARKKALKKAQTSLPI